MSRDSAFIDRFSIFCETHSVIDRGVIYSYEDLKKQIDYYSVICHNNDVKEGQVVFILGDYSFGSIALFLALDINKNIVVPITSQIESEIAERVNEVHPDWIVNTKNDTWQCCEYENKIKRHDLINKLVCLGDSGLILFSSGSTGKPKAMVHNLSNLISSFQGKKSRSINFLVFLMFDHIGGLNTLLNCLSIGATITIPENRRPDYICSLIEKFSIAVLPSSPTFLNLLLISKAYEDYNLSSLRLITYGTEPMPESLLKKLKDAFYSVKFLQTFGTSETGIAKTVSESSSSNFLKFDDPNQECKIVDGELWLRSKTQILGYMNHSNESFTKDGWFRTGDLVEISENGFMRIIGRSKEVLNIGGEKVLPVEVESIILEVPSVEDCLVSGMPNSITGQMVVANILLKHGFDSSIEKGIIKKHCKVRLDAFKVPSKIVFVESVAFSDRFKKKRNS